MSYISMPNIGEVGNLGSQIQQYFSLEAIAAVNNKTIVFPESSDSIMHGLKFSRLLKIPIHIVSDSDLSNFFRVGVDDTQIVDERVYALDPQANYAFMTRFDLYHYWYTKIKEKVDNIEFHDLLLSETQKILSAIKNSAITVSLHVRRGDYLLPQHAHFVELTTNYYKRAIAEFSNLDFQLLVFSNDIQWCQENLHSLHSNIYYVQGNDDFTDMCLMSLCNHNIIANSSFSWWAAYLNKNPDKIVVCPNKYLQNHPLCSVINNNYYPHSWVSIVV